MGSMQKWDARYGAHDYVTPTEPVPFLVEKCADLVPGRALCLAAGSGRNAVFLASIGFEVTAVDISGVGLGEKQSSKAGTVCSRHSPSITWAATGGPGIPPIWHEGWICSRRSPAGASAFLKTARSRIPNRVRAGQLQW